LNSYDYIVADVFTDTPLKGNPVAVFLDAADLTSLDMQQIANEMHLSETVFVLPPEEDGNVKVRIFTPVNELPFAGHPTLGTAIVLGESHVGNKILIETCMGTVPFTLTRNRDDHVHSARMQQPIPTWENFDRSDELLIALGLEEAVTPVEIYHNGPRHVFVGLNSITKLKKLSPDHRALSGFPDMATNCFAGSGTSWRMRMFSPAYGVIEDAATGSAAGPLAVHLIRHGLITVGEPIKIIQGVEIGRPSTMLAQAKGTKERIESIEVSGSAVVIIRGTFYF
jgi:trans-2,3-dihydro-3-hydroxyanthranilate isomerase